ncbi:hypothetical protein D3C71_1435590 [compost metagenome]
MIRYVLAKARHKVVRKKWAVGRRGKKMTAGGLAIAEVAHACQNARERAGMAVQRIRQHRQA